MPTSKLAQLSKVRLEYFEHGHGPERIVLIHGFQASARIWAMVQEALPADRYTTIAINNRGAGNSDAPPNESDFGVQPFAADAHELVLRLGWDQFTLVGHSLGGATVAQFAVDHPQLLKCLVLLDPADPDGRKGTAEEIERAVEGFSVARRARLAHGGGGDGVAAPVVAAPVVAAPVIGSNSDSTGSAVADIGARGTGAPTELLALLTADMNNAPERRLRGSLRSMFQIRVGDRLRALSVPMLLICGDQDELIPLQNMLDTWAKLPPGAGLHVWHGIGHSPNLDCPQALAAVLQQFVEVTVASNTLPTRN